MKKRWTKKEIEILKNDYEANAPEFLCQILSDRTWGAIQTKASRFKLTHRTPEERFWKHVDQKDINGCWNWTGYCTKGGYGQIEINRKMIYVHIFSYILHFKEIPKDKPYVLHECDNRKCVNPKHLFVGTHQDNMDDMILKNRQAKGENNGNHKLNENQVKKIRRLCLEGKLLQKEMAKLFNVHVETIGRIHRNKTWK